MKNVRIWFKFKGRIFGVSVLNDYDLDKIIKPLKKKVGKALKVYDNLSIHISDSHTGIPSSKLYEMTAGYIARNSHLAGSTFQNPLYVFVTEIFLKWKTPEDLPETIYSRNPTFLNRIETFEALYHIHRNQWIRQESGSGDLWEFPLLDNAFGLGKTRFAQNYVKMAQAMFSNVQECGKFEQMLCNTRTIRVRIPQNSYNHEDSHRSLLMIIKRTMEKIYLESYKECPVYESATDYLYDIINVVGVKRYFNKHLLLGDSTETSVLELPSSIGYGP